MLETPIHDPMAKFQLSKEPALPSKCVACGKDADGQTEFVDLTASIDYYGAVLLCSNCGKEIAYQLFDFKDDEDVQDAKDEIERVNNKIYDLEEKNRVLESVVFTYGLPVDVDGVEPDNSADPVKEPNDSGTEDFTLPESKTKSGPFK